MYCCLLSPVLNEPLAEHTVNITEELGHGKSRQGTCWPAGSLKDSDVSPQRGEKGCTFGKSELKPQSPNKHRSHRNMTKDAVDEFKNDRQTQASRVQQAQDVLKAFTHRAAQGVACSAVDLETGHIFRAMYSLDKNLVELVITASGKPKVTCPLVEVRRLCHSEEGSEALPPQVMAALSKQDQERLIMVEHARGRLLLLERSVLAKQQFHLCLKILSIHSQLHDDIQV